jgi:hypothetical protein
MRPRPETDTPPTEPLDDLPGLLDDHYGVSINGP